MCQYINCSHQGPHWLYMDFCEKVRNVDYLDYVVRIAESHKSEDWNWKVELAMQTYMGLEHQRLIRKEPYMQKGEAYPYALLDIDERVQRCEERRRTLFARLDQVKF